MNKTIKETLAHFKVKKLANEKDIIVLDDKRPDALYESVKEAHGDKLPDDWIYSTYESILSTLDDYTINGEEDLENYRSEIVDGLVDIYNSDLMEWAKSNVDVIDEAQQEFGTMDNSFIGNISCGQYLAIDQIFSIVSEYLKTCKEEEAEA